MRILLVAASICFSSSLWAQATIDQADDAFAERANDRNQIQKALKLYTKAVKESQLTEDKIYAVEQIGRLANYENSIITADRNAKDYRIELFENCLNATDSIAPKAINEETPAYYYVRGLCLAQWAKARGITTSLFRTKELLGYLETGRELDPSYEGGGFDRILSAVYINLPPINVFGPTRDYKLSLSHSNAAIKSPAYEGALNPALETGNYFFNAYEYKATALAKSGNKTEARTVIKAAIDRIKRGDINPDREPETAVDLKNLEQLLKDI